MDGIDQDDRRYDGPDPDELRDRWLDEQWEADTLERGDGGYNEDDFIEWADSTRDVRELRHAAGYRMQWRTRAGTLLPVPESGGSGA